MQVAQGVETFEGVVIVTNTGGRRFQGLSAIAPDVYLAQGGRTVAAPLPRDAVGTLLDLEPGASRELVACGRASGLAPGRYEVRAVLRVFGQGERSPEGGPWPLEILPREDLR